jgi:hypothetical protein
VGVEAKFHAFLTSTPDGAEATSRVPLLPEKDSAVYPLERRLGGSTDRLYII